MVDLNLDTDDAAELSELASNATLVTICPLVQLCGRDFRPARKGAQKMSMLRHVFAKWQIDMIFRCDDLELPANDSARHYLVYNFVLCHRTARLVKEFSPDFVMVRDWRSVYEVEAKNGQSARLIGDSMKDTYDRAKLETPISPPLPAAGGGALRHEGPVRVDRPPPPRSTSAGASYETKMSHLDFILHALNGIQRKWVYLEPIFGRGSLPNEAKRFKSVDEDFRDIMRNVEADPKLFGLVDPHVHRDIRRTLETMLDQLDRCQKALSDFLEEKRSAFPRFYFIGDDDLLEILGQAKNPAVIQSHLKKLFQGVSRVVFDDAKTTITAMVSASEVVAVWESNLQADFNVVDLETGVATSDRVEEWLATFTDEMKATLASLLANYLAALARAAVCKSNLQPDFNLETHTGQDLSGMPVTQLKVKALVMDLVHNMDVLDQLDRARCRDAHDWAWHKQLRYRRRCGAPRSACPTGPSATYEYQGNAGKLVHTPLTDKCYLTLTQGMHMGFGGNPYGPAGTGKTESVKALGNAFGRQVLVFNCDEGADPASTPRIDFQSMGRIFIGLVKCGAWGCFDEFNRLKEDQLSAISQQIQLIQDAIKGHIPVLRLLGRDVDVDFDAGIFVTLNPAGKDYGGRSQIPDNLKALFRPVAMGRPDNELIAQLLTPQRHYDWGLRALKAVLNTGGKLVLDARGAGGGLPPAAEGELLIKAVRVNTLSKLTFGDTARFLALIGDVFPGVASGDVAGGALEVAIRDVMASGVMNPKSMPRQQLLGEMDLDTREWSDGVLTDAARAVVREPPEVRSWIVCDGDVDPEWIESLNSVLDDNHLLTLPNGERIAFGDNVNFLFETHDLRFASPATVSRMGMIFLSDEDIDTRRVVTRRRRRRRRPEGCGKNLMIRHAFAARRKVGVATLHCSARTDASHVIAKIGQCCSLFSAPEGRVYRPRDCERLVLYLKDLNLPRPDAYDTCMLIAFLQQLVTFRGFYDASLEFLRLERRSSTASSAACSGAAGASCPRSAAPTSDAAGGAIGAKGGGGGGAAPLLRRVETAEFRAVVGKGVDYYERENAELRMLLFDRVLDHVARVDRVISRPGGNLLLIGRSGVGRRTAVRLVAYMRGYAFVGPTAVRADDDAVKHFRSELKPALQTVAVEGQEAVFYVEDHHFAVGACLELVNSVLSAGAAPGRDRPALRAAREVPGLFGADELEGLFAQLREPMADEGTALSPYEFFVARVAAPRLRRHGPDERRAVRCESNPALFTRCTILWMGAWRRDTMRAVPAMMDGVRKLILADGAGDGDDAAAAGAPAPPRERKGGEAKAARGKSARGEARAARARAGAAPRRPRPAAAAAATPAATSTTSSSRRSRPCTSRPRRRREFVLFLENWRMLHDQMRGGIRTKLSHLSAGLAKLEEASATVDSLSNNAEVEQAKLVEAQKGADAAMEMITKTLSEATGRRGEVNDLKTEVTRGDTISRQGEIKQELSSIQPVLETAKAAVGQIKAEHLNEIRSLKMPPEPIADVLGAVLKLLGISDAEFGDKTREAEKLRARLALAEGTLDKAQHLLGKLSGEQARWQTQAGDLRSELASLPRQLLVAAGFLTYLSRCPEDAREAALADWTATVGLAAFDFTSLLATESRLLAWKQVGLPADPLSMENALVVAHNPGARVPFVIDPADAAWLVARRRRRPALEVLQSADARFGTTVELAVRFGKTLLIFDVERAAPAPPRRRRQRRRPNAAAALETPSPRARRRLEPVLYRSRAATWP
ncbi:dynein light chain binding protein [Aureococcus anophagefferens]|nr:dynein light chain binding protein [Aureococcus anophagefferens]